MMTLFNLQESSRAVDIAVLYQGAIYVRIHVVEKITVQTF